STQRPRASQQGAGSGRRGLRRLPRCIACHSGESPNAAACSNAPSRFVIDASRLIHRCRDCLGARARPQTLEGRSIGILINDGSDAAALDALVAAAQAEGAMVKIVAPKLGGATLSDGRKQPADAQLAGAPSLIFDAVAVLLSEAAGEKLMKESAAVGFAAFAWAHLKAIAFDAGAAKLLEAGNVGRDAGIVDAADTTAFIAAAKSPPVGARTAAAHLGLTRRGRRRPARDGDGLRRPAPASAAPGPRATADAPPAPAPRRRAAAPASARA